MLCLKNFKKEKNIITFHSAYRKIFSLKNGIKHLLVILLPVAIILTMLEFYFERKIEEGFLNHLKAVEKKNVLQTSQTITRDFHYIYQDLYLLGKSPLLKNYLDTNNPSSMYQLKTSLINFCHTRNIYKKLSLIDLNGNEQIVAHTANTNTKQYSKETELALRGINLEKETMYISPLAPDSKGGVVQYPIRPIIKFAVPVFNSKNQKRGALVLYYPGERIDKVIVDFSKNVLGKMMLLNAEGYWLYHPNKSMRWGFIFPEKKNINFKVIYASAWNKINNMEEGQFIDKDGLFTFVSIDILKDIKTFSPITISANNYYRWTIVSHISLAKLKMLKSAKVKNIKYIFAFLSILLFIIALILTRVTLGRSFIHYKMEKFSNTVMQSPNIILMITPDGTIEYANEAYQKQTGYSYKELIGKKIWLQKNIGMTLRKIVKIRDTLNEKSEWQGEVGVTKKDGTTFWSSVSVVPIIEKEGLQSHFLVIISDISERKNAEEKLKQLHNELKKDMKAAEKMQISLLPNKHLKFNGIDYTWYFKPSEKLGGDIFNVFNLDENRIGIYMIDVCGHGIKSAISSITISRLLSPYSEYPNLLKSTNRKTGKYTIMSPARVLLNLNERFPFKDENDEFFTILYGIINIKKLRFIYSSAGHPGFILARNGKKTILPYTRGFPIGFTEKPDYIDSILELEKRDRIILFSDGIIEAINNMEIPFGVERCRMIVEKNKNNSIDTLTEQFIKEHELWISNKKTTDDISLLTIEIS